MYGENVSEIDSEHVHRWAPGNTGASVNLAWKYYPNTAENVQQKRMYIDGLLIRVITHGKNLYHNYFCLFPGEKTMYTII